MYFTRHPLNPLITPSDVQPSRSDMEIIGTFNAGVTLVQDGMVMLLRVAERPLNDDTDVMLCPLLDDSGELIVTRVRRHDPTFDTSDPRVVRHRPTGAVLLTSMSHLRLAHSADGLHWAVEPRAWMQPQPPYENFGMEDARITRIDDTYFVNYTAVSQHGIATALIETHDFVHMEWHGVIFPPSNRDVTFFPERIGGRFTAYHRPMPGDLGKYNIWYAASPDMKHWGEHRIVLQAGDGGWEAGRVGGGAPPVRTDRGWLSIYHAADAANRYCLGAFLTPLDQPWRVIARSRTPVLEPVAPYETDGFFSDVVFTCGAVVRDDLLYVYYGAADQYIALATAPLDALLDGLEPVN